MAITYEIHPALGVVLVRYCGLSTVEMNIEALLAYLRDPRFDPNFHIFYDQSAGEVQHDDYTRMTKLASALQPLFQKRAANSRTSLFCPTDEMFARARVYGAVSDSWTKRKLGIFRTKHEALRFVFLDPTDPEIINTLWPTPDACIEPAP